MTSRLQKSSRAPQKSAADSKWRIARRPDFLTVPSLGIVVPVLVLLGISVFLLPALLGRGILFDVDLISSRLPFRALTGPAYQDTIVCRQDTVDYFPAIANIKQGLLHWQLPTWSPWEVGGAPLAGLPNAGVFSPLALPYFVLPLWLAPAFVKLTEVVVAIVGVIAFLRRRGVSWAAAWLAGFVFVTSGFMIMWSNWPQTRVAALIPLLLWAVDRVVDLHRAKDVVVLAVTSAAMLLGGFPAVTMYALVLAGVYVLVRLWVLYRRRWRDALGVVGAAGAGVALGVGLAAVQMAPFVANLSAVFAGRHKTGRNLPFSTALTLVDPSARGTCRGGVWYGDVIPIEAVGYVGCGALVLVVLAAALPRQLGQERGTRPWLFGSFAIAAWMIWIGGPLLRAFGLIPIIGNNSISRGQSVVGFIVACIAALGFDLLQRRARDASTDPAAPPPIKRWRTALVVAVAAILSIAVLVAALIDAHRRNYLDHLGESLVWPIVLLVVSVTAVALVYAGPRRFARWGPILIAVIVVAQGSAFARTMLPLSQRELFFPTTQTHEYLAQHLGEDRYGAGDNTMDAALSDWYHLRTPTGHEFTDPRWKELLATVDPDVQRTVTYSRFTPNLPFDRVAESGILDRLAVRYWTASPRRAVGTVESLEKKGRVELTEDKDATCAVDAGPLRGITVHLAERISRTPSGSKPLLHVEVSKGNWSRQGAVLLDGTAPGPGPVTVAIAGEDLQGGGQAQVRVWLSGMDGARYFAGEGRKLSCARVVPNKRTDRVRLVEASAESAIYERLDSLPRVRWASESRVISPDEQAAALQAGVPTGTVVLDSGATPPATGGTGSVAVATDDGNRIVVDTDSTGQGYLVVADSIVRPGWTARVDGKPAPLVRADHALAAVPVPAGQHRVELTYSVPGLRLGIAVTLLAGLIAVALLAAPAILRRRRRNQWAHGRGNPTRES